MPPAPSIYTQQILVTREKISDRYNNGWMCAYKVPTYLADYR